MNHRVRPALTLEVRLQVANKCLETHRALMHQSGLQERIQWSLRTRWIQMSQGEQPWLALRCDVHASDHIESEQAQHGEVFLTDGFFLHVRPDQPKTPQGSWACTKGSKSR